MFDRRAPNKITPANAGGSPRFQFERLWPGIAEFCRWPDSMRKLVLIIALLISSGARAEQVNDFATVRDAWSHIRTVYRHAEHLNAWEPPPFEEIAKPTSVIDGHHFTVLHFDVAQNGGLYIVERLINDRYRIIGQCHGQSVAFSRQSGVVLARVHYHISAAEGSDESIPFQNGVFGTFQFSDIRPEFNK